MANTRMVFNNSRVILNMPGGGLNGFDLFSGTNTIVTQQSATGMSVFSVAEGAPSTGQANALTLRGGTAIFEEIVEAIGLDHLLLKRAASEQAAKELRYTYDKALEYCRSVRQYSVSPGNFAGGLSTIEEKSMGAVIKSGSRPIQGVIKVSCPAPHPGLWLLDSTPDPYWMQFGITNPNDNEGLMDLASCGAHIVFLVTGRGNVVGSAVAPCIKIRQRCDLRPHGGRYGLQCQPRAPGRMHPERAGPPPDRTGGKNCRRSAHQERSPGTPRVLCTV